MVSPAEFVTQVKREFQKVTWPDKTETVGMSVAVVIFSVVFMIYFFMSFSFRCFNHNKSLYPKICSRVCFSSFALTSAGFSSTNDLYC